MCGPALGTYATMQKVWVAALVVVFVGCASSAQPNNNTTVSNNNVGGNVEVTVGGNAEAETSPETDVAAEVDVSP